MEINEKRKLRVAVIGCGRISVMHFASIKMLGEELVGCCDVGLIFLDFRFTIPNFPSRLLSYMQRSMPVIAATDTSTDVGSVAELGGFGWRCESRDPEDFVRVFELAISADTEKMGEAAAKYLTENYSVEKSAEIILGEYERVRK